MGSEVQARGLAEHLEHDVDQIVRGVAQKQDPGIVGDQPSTRTYPHAGRGGRMTDGPHPSSKKSTEPSSTS